MEALGRPLVVDLPNSKHHFLIRTFRLTLAGDEMDLYG
jgi:hypothetical protein